MNIQNFEFISIDFIIAFAIKIFAIVFSFLYLIYAIVVFKQTEVMNKTLESKNNYIFIIVSMTQIAVGLILIILSFFIL